MSELAQLMEILHNPLLQQALVLLVALFAGLLLMTLAGAHRCDARQHAGPGVGCLPY